MRATEVACNPSAIPADERSRYTVLIDRLRTAIRERRELPDGYAFRLEGSGISFLETAEWLNIERLCCPFFDIRLEAMAGCAEWWVTLQGPAGVKDLLDAAFQSSY